MSASYRSFATLFDTHIVPKFVFVAILDPSWCQAIQEEMAALQQIGTWDLVPCPMDHKWLGVVGSIL